MSTYWRYECLDHQPAITSEDCGNHDTGLDKMREFYRRRSDLVLAVEVLSSLDLDVWNLGYDTNARTAVAFLLAHPRCRLQARSEYGDVAALVEASGNDHSPDCPCLTKERGE